MKGFENTYSRCIACGAESTGYVSESLYLDTNCPFCGAILEGFLLIETGDKMRWIDENITKPSRKGSNRTGSNWVTCADGFTLSVVTGYGNYCHPRPDGDEIDEHYAPFTHAEVGYPSERPEPWNVWENYCDDSDKPTQTVYGYVPVDIISDLIELHGGEVE